MRGRSLCFFHTRVSARPPARPQTMPLLEDGNAIQLGIASVIRRVLMCDIEYKAAYVLLHAYKLALFNLKNVHPEPWYKDVVTVDPASDAENAGTATEPCTYEQLEALTDDQTDVGAPPLSPSVGDRVGSTEHYTSASSESAETMGMGMEKMPPHSTTTEHNSSDTPEYPDPEKMSEKEFEELVMRATGNKTYFMPEDPHPPRNTSDDKQTMNDLFNLAGSLRKDEAG